ncbi:hypothetical protein [Luteimonas kalidii]|uniref:Uncharacterized protein n=1 Tax=Luteimonas kalidii TaxID=3042025 RepID=A0ABT6JP10_9GAMM|nr:hypothetical protein [Luteimonas kalidii]MDH5832413.1 hypothetical protein [Luteimonas kalidii]
MFAVLRHRDFRRRLAAQLVALPGTRLPVVARSLSLIQARRPVMTQYATVLVHGRGYGEGASASVRAVSISINPLRRPHDTMLEISHEVPGPRLLQPRKIRRDGAGRR